MLMSLQVAPTSVQVRSLNREGLCQLQNGRAGEKTNLYTATCDIIRRWEIQAKRS